MNERLWSAHNEQLATDCKCSCHKEIRLSGAIGVKSVVVQISAVIIASHRLSHEVALVEQSEVQL